MKPRRHVATMTLEKSVRVVPPQQPQPLIGAARAGLPPAGAHLVYQGGPLIQNVNVFAIYWGDDWNGAQAGLAGQLTGFFQYIVTSPLIAQLGEYSTNGMNIGPGAFIGHVTLPTGALGAAVTDADLRAELAQLIQAGTVPAPNANSLYFIFLPPGVSLSMGGDQSCVQFCGYHDVMNGNVYYAAMPFPNCPGCQGGLSAFDALTEVASHELCEAITDPVPGQGWYDPQNDEIGDICAWIPKALGGYNVQQEWSNAANACI